MDNSGNIDLLTSFRKLMAENKSLETRLEDYAKMIGNRDNEIEMLQAMLSEANAYRSSTDSQVKELKELQLYINDLQQQLAISTYLPNSGQLQPGNTVSMERQLQQLQQSYAHLQSQLTDLRTQLEEMNNRNLLLQQQNSRVAELESLLRNAEDEIERQNDPTALHKK
ncbi:MAG: hypothetical protein H7X88_04860 [Gloeobacteraceae cyanobacterium ES-bin-316]|nr:hypothetical protein [Ferruginibacter sp.]